MMFFLMLPCYIIVAIAFIYTMNDVGKQNGNLILGVKIPTSQMENTEVLKMVAQYKKAERLLNMFMICLFVISFFLRNYEMISTIYSCLWCFVYLGGMQLLFFRYYDKLYAYKKSQGWIVGEAYKVSYAYQAKELVEKRIYPFWHWGIVFLLTAFGCRLWRPEFFDNELLGYTIIAVNSGLMLLFLIGYIIFARYRKEVDRSLTKERIEFYQYQSYQRTKVMVWSSYINAFGWLIGGLFPARVENAMTIVIVAICISVLLCTLLFVVIYKVNERRRAVNEIEAALEEDVVDDDAYWRGGLYSNPHDPKLWVEKRNGFGLQSNNAKPAAKAINVGSAILIIGLFVWMLTLVPIDFPGLSLRIEDDQLYVEATQYDTSINLMEVDQAFLIEELPKIYRNEGYADKGYDFGKFRVIGYGQCKVYINKNIAPYLVMYVDDAIYLINSDEEGELQECISYLTQAGKMIEAE